MNNEENVPMTEGEMISLSKSFLPHPEKRESRAFLTNGVILLILILGTTLVLLK